MPFTENNGAKLYWDEQGSGTPVLLVMGASFSSALWYQVIPSLAEHHRVIWFDNRGTGDSDTTKGVTVGQMADDAIAVVDAAGVGAAHIYGVSMGGAIVQEIALRHSQRVSSMILGCTGILSAEKPRLPRYFLPLYYLPRSILTWLVNKNEAYGSAAPEELVEEDQAKIASDKRTRRGLIEQQKAIRSYRVTLNDVRKLSMPALVIHGTEDKTVPFSYGEELAETLPNSQFVKLDGAGHNFTVATKEIANQAVINFLCGIDKKD